MEPTGEGSVRSNVGIARPGRQGDGRRAVAGPEAGAAVPFVLLAMGGVGLHRVAGHHVVV